MEEKERQEKEKEIKIDKAAAREATAADKANEEKKTDAQAETEGKDGKQEKDNADDKLDKANKTIADLKDKYLRTLAEFDNYKKRTLKEKAELILNGSEKTVVAILPVLDDFERALKNDTDDPKAIREGMEMIYKKFEKALESLGVKKIETTEKDFDTDFHEAVAMVPGQADEKKGKVIDCLQTGYMLNDKVIRHAKVAVGQ